jgi:hypothetical protein
MKFELFNTMKLLFSLLFIGTLALAQTPSDTISIDSTTAKETKMTQFDTLSYSEEFKRDYWRSFFGGRFGLNQFRFKIDENLVDRIGVTGLPLLDSEGNVLKNRFVNNPTFNTGFNAAVFFRFVRGSFFIQPELSYASKSGKFDVLNKDGSLYKRINASVQSAEIPILIGVRTRKSRVYFGPVSTFTYGMNKDMKNILSDYLNAEILNSSFFNRPTLNFHVGVAYELKGMFLDFRYEKGLRSYTVQQLGPSNSPQNFNLVGDGFYFTLGFLGN